VAGSSSSASGPLPGGPGGVAQLRRVAVADGGCRHRGLRRVPPFGRPSLG
jgi:hypothetical protein